MYNFLHFDSFQVLSSFLFMVWDVILIIADKTDWEGGEPEGEHVCDHRGRFLTAVKKSKNKVKPSCCTIET